MFKRREKRSIAQTTKQFVWPSMGWKRMGLYLRHRILRLNDSPRNIALGLALGAGVSFSPLMMTHLIQGGIFAYLLRANIPAALIGTIIGNPWTFPFIWYASLSLGSAIFTLAGLPVDASPPSDVTLNMIWAMIFDDPMRLFLPWFVGGYILCIGLTAVLYPIYLHLIKAAKRIKVRKKQAGENS